MFADTPTRREFATLLLAAYPNAIAPATEAVLLAPMHMPLKNEQFAFVPIDIASIPEFRHARPIATPPTAELLALRPKARELFAEHTLAFPIAIQPKPAAFARLPSATDAPLPQFDPFPIHVPLFAVAPRPIP